VPLIRSNFYVTESNADRNRLFYFRHDIWKRLSAPSIVSLKESMFEEMPMDRITKLLSVRKLGFSKIRSIDHEFEEKTANYAIWYFDPWTEYQQYYGTGFQCHHVREGEWAVCVVWSSSALILTSHYNQAGLGARFSRWETCCPSS
jgi:hypothetical protein